MPQGICGSQWSVLCNWYFSPFLSGVRTHVAGLQLHVPLIADPPYCSPPLFFNEMVPCFVAKMSLKLLNLGLPSRITDTCIILSLIHAYAMYVCVHECVCLHVYKGQSTTSNVISRTCSSVFKSGFLARLEATEPQGSTSLHLPSNENTCATMPSFGTWVMRLKLGSLFTMKGLYQLSYQLSPDSYCLKENLHKFWKNS